jgi:hypothetical protein
MSRIIKFFKEWSRLLLSGKSWGEKSAKVLIPLVTAGGLLFFFKDQVTLSLPLWQWLLAPLALVYLAITAKIAFDRSVELDLTVGNDLESEPMFNTWRLRVKNKNHKPVKVIVEMNAIWSDRQEPQVHSTIFPLKLEWSDTRSASEQLLPYDRSNTVMIGRLVPDRLTTGWIFLVTGANYQHPISLDGVQRICCEMNVHSPDHTGSTQCRFIFERVESVRPEAPPQFITEMVGSVPVERLISPLPQFRVLKIDDATWTQLMTSSTKPVPDHPIAQFPDTTAKAIAPVKQEIAGGNQSQKPIKKVRNKRHHR